MCAREKGSLQRGMYFREPPGVSVVLMSRRPSAPYVDTLSEDATELEYEGHDARREGSLDPRALDQPRTSPNGALTENGMFADAVTRYHRGEIEAPKVRVYEKLRPGIWSDRGLFDLVGFSYAVTDGRRAFRFKMKSSLEPDETGPMVRAEAPTRVIPSWVKQAVYKRDKGRCVLCGSSDHLHFDHDLPYSRGGASILPENVRLLCARHNLAKAARIE